MSVRAKKAKTTQAVTNPSQKSPLAASTLPKPTGLELLSEVALATSQNRTAQAALVRPVPAGLAGSCLPELNRVKFPTRSTKRLEAKASVAVAPNLPPPVIGQEQLDPTTFGSLVLQAFLVSVLRMFL